MTPLLRFVFAAAIALFVSPAALAFHTGGAGRGGTETGADVLLSDSMHLVVGKRIGLVCNHTAVIRDGRHLIDVFGSMNPNPLVAVFVPEHGIAGTLGAGQTVRDSAVAGVPVHSLYGATRKPTADMLRGIDVLLFDMQDVGARFYTYVSTLVLCMEAAALHHITFIVLDRPNPLGGDEIEGPVLDLARRSFVGMLPMPVRSGLTLAETARMAAGERWIRGAERLDLRVIPMRGWTRALRYRDTGLRWLPPSPNVPDPETALAYVGMCLLEGSTYSEGRGTDLPFLLCGAPRLRHELLAGALNAMQLPGVRFDTVSFVPRERIGAPDPKHAGKTCRGVRIAILDPSRFRPFRTGAALIHTLARLGDSGWATTPYLDQLAGRSRFLSSIADVNALRTSVQCWEQECAAFSRRRAPYLLYN